MRRPEPSIRRGTLANARRSGYTPTVTEAECLVTAYHPCERQSTWPFLLPNGTNSDRFKPMRGCLKPLLQL